MNFESPNLKRSGVIAGFTLVELLVVIAIIGVLVGLLLPAVQAAREAARRMSCSNNCAQLGLAVHNYEFAAEFLPPGVTSKTGPVVNDEKGEDVSWLIRILPFVEQQNAYDRYDDSKSVYDPANVSLRRLSIPTFLCPSYPHATSMNGYGVTNYAGCHHDVEAPIDDDNHGLLFLNSKVRYSEIRDGSSYTILIGEMMPYGNSLGWVSGTASSLRNTSSIGAASGAMIRPTLTMGTSTVGGFGSSHAGGGNFAFADGSVRFIMENVDPQVFKKFGHRADGNVVEDGW